MTTMKTGKTERKGKNNMMYKVSGVRKQKMEEKTKEVAKIMLFSLKTLAMKMANKSGRAESQ